MWRRVVQLVLMMLLRVREVVRMWWWWKLTRVGGGRLYLRKWYALWWCNARTFGIRLDRIHASGW